MKMPIGKNPKYSSKDVLQSIINAFRDAFDLNRQTFDEERELEFCKFFSSRIAPFIGASVEIDRFAIVCKDRLSKKISAFTKEGGIVDDNCKVENNNDSRIILILESPSEKEYSEVYPGDFKKRPLPANAEKGGTTGCNIRDSFATICKNSIFTDWRIGLVNPIQYSCSLGGRLAPEIRNEVFAALFQDPKFSNDFACRLNRMRNVKQYVVINCCTSPNHLLVDMFLKQKQIPYIKIAHPSSPYFKKLCTKHTINNCNLCCKIISYKSDGLSYISFARTFSSEILTKVIITNKAS